MDPLALCVKVTNLLFFINPFTLQHAEINVEKFNNAPFRSILTPKQLVEFTVVDVAFNAAAAAGATTTKGRHGQRVEEVTVCRSDRLGQEDALVTTRTHLARCCTPATRCWATTSAAPC